MGGCRGLHERQLNCEILNWRLRSEGEMVGQLSQLQGSRFFGFRFKPKA
uniref:Uncharacterized protein n=1 Tax=Parascaris univalens TaxID=6257 RepID=A0A915BLR0_PARUN